MSDKKLDATSFLLWYLGSQPDLISEVIEAGKARDITSDQIFEARRKLGGRIHTSEVSKWHDPENCPKPESPQKWYKVWELAREIGGPR